jgi:predicted RNA-binding protein with RPS1 domain
MTKKFMILRDSRFFLWFFIAAMFIMRPALTWKLFQRRPSLGKCLSVSSSSNIPSLYTKDKVDKNITAPILPVPTNLTIGQEVRIKVMQFGPLGASVLVNGEVRGLVSQDEIWRYRNKNDNKDILLNDELTAYVGRIREDGKVSLILRPIGVARHKEAKEVVREALEGSPSGSIPIGDKSTPEDIAFYFHGMSKTDFKTAVGLLYKDGIAQPGSFFTTLMTEEERVDRTAAKSNAPKPASNTASSSTSTSIFIGNMANNVNEENLRKLVAVRLNIDDAVQEGNPIKAVRLVFDRETKKPKGYGYVELIDKSWQTKAYDAMQGIKMDGRSLRVDIAAPLNREVRTASQSSNEVGKQSLATSASKPWTKAPSASASSSSSQSQRPSFAATASRGNSNASADAPRRRPMIGSNKSSLLKNFDSDR